MKTVQFQILGIGIVSHSVPLVNSKKSSRVSLHSALEIFQTFLYKFHATQFLWVYKGFSFTWSSCILSLKSLDLLIHYI